MKPKFLVNPKTDNYINFKSLVLSDRFYWFRSETIKENDIESNRVGFDNYSYLSHMFLQRPVDSCLYSKENSKYLEYIHQIFKEIVDFNELDPQVIYRMNANAVYPTEKKLPSPLHVDHNFPHKNMIIYLTDPQGGSTIVEDTEYLPKEDDVLIFDGQSMHCARPPSKDVRIVLVITFL